MRQHFSNSAFGTELQRVQTNKKEMSFKHLLSQKFNESQRIPKLSSATLVALFQPISRHYKVISPKISSDTLVPLFQPKSRYYMIIFPKLSLDTLGVPSDLTLQFGHIG